MTALIVGALMVLGVLASSMPWGYKAVTIFLIVGAALSLVDE